RQRQDLVLRRDQEHRARAAQKPDHAGPGVRPLVARRRLERDHADARAALERSADAAASPHDADPTLSAPAGDPPAGLLPRPDGGGGGRRAAPQPRHRAQALRARQGPAQETDVPDGRTMMRSDDAEDREIREMFERAREADGAGAPDFKRMLAGDRRPT